MAIRIDPEFKALIPPLTAEEYAGLEKSIIREGCRDPLVLWGDILIDGHNRWEICAKHGGIPFRTVQRDFGNRDDAMLWMIQNQFARRNLSSAQRIDMIMKYEEVVKARAKERQLTTLAQNTDTDREILPERDAGRARDELGHMAGVSGKTYEHGAKVLREAPDTVKQAVLSGEMSINQAYQQVRRQEKIDEVNRRIDEHEKQQTGVISMERPNRKYNIIYADPPWKYWESGNKNQELHYKTMTIDDICDIPVANLADDDCVLFMWATYPILKEAFRVIEAWGFNYSTAAFVWVKKNKNADTPFIGCGSWTRANSEICLLATRGKVLRLDASVSQVVESPIEEHSKKPDIVRELITQLVGKLPRVELFCRHPAEGWDVWGNEA